MDTLFELLKLEAADLQNTFARASISGQGTPQEVAEFREHAVQDFVRRFFPFPYRVAKGNIRDLALHQLQRSGLTLPSTGHLQAGFAHLRRPLMSNARPQP